MVNARPGVRRYTSARFDGVHAEIITAFDRAVETLRGLGARVEEVDIPSIHDSPVYALIMLAEAFAYHEQDLRERPALYGDVLRERFLAGGLFTASEYVQAQRLRERVRHETLAALARVDVLVTPTAVAPAAPFAAALDAAAPFPKNNTAPFNLSGLPGLALPCGFSTSGLPLSLHIAGRPFDEATVFRAGHAYEQATDWHRRRPPI